MQREPVSFRSGKRRKQAASPPMPLATPAATIGSAAMKRPTPFLTHPSRAERGREAPMVISPSRLAHLLVDTVRYVRADLRRRSRDD